MFVSQSDSNVSSCIVFVWCWEALWHLDLQVSRHFCSPCVGRNALEMPCIKRTVRILENKSYEGLGCCNHLCSSGALLHMLEPQ